MRSLWKRLTRRMPIKTGPDAEVDLGAAGEALARRLEGLGGYRVLRALDPDAGIERLGPPQVGQRIAAVIDSETTGLDVEADRMVELAIQRFLIEPDGRINAVERVRSWREDPGRPMPERLVRLTGLSDADLRDRRFDEEMIVALLDSADLVIAHNAAFDRPFVERRLPQLAPGAWACSLDQLDWLDLGYDGRSLGHLLLQSGYYFDGHRAAHDVVALTTLLGVELPDGRTILSHLLARCDRDSVRVEAVGAPYDAKDLLKRSGYRWDGAARHWWREIDSDALDAEREWLDQQVYLGRGSPRVRTITARDRFRRKV